MSEKKLLHRICLSIDRTMKNREYINELMNQEIDGFNSSSQSLELQEYFSKNPEARQEYAALVDLRNALSAVEELSPSENLLKRVMLAVPSNPSTFEAKRPLLDQIRSVRFIPAFASGLAFGVMLFVLIIVLFKNNESVKLATLVGTLSSGTPLSSGHHLTSARVEREGISEVYTVSSWKEYVVVDVTIEAANSHQVSISFDKAKLLMKGYIDLENKGSFMNVESDQIQFPARGRGHYSIIFEELTNKPILEIRTFAGSNLIDRTMLPIVQ